MIRRAKVAGRFYPADAATLQRDVDGYFVGSALPEKAMLVMAPHAGYMYSGAVAGAVYASVIVPDNVILLGPNHTGDGQYVSVMSRGAWQTPLGEVPINEELASSVLASSDLFKDDNAAHAMEHSLEVQLPFLLKANKKVSIVPITIMSAKIYECETMGKALAKVIKAFGKDVLMAVSTDMNHYESDKITRHKDAMAIERALALDAKGLLEVADKKDITMCGVIPAVVGLFAANALGASSARLVKYATSADAGAGKEQVVGYAGILVK